jgi:hypothetical protein
MKAASAAEAEEAGEGEAVALRTAAHAAGRDWA